MRGIVFVLQLLGVAPMPCKLIRNLNNMAIAFAVM